MKSRIFWGLTVAILIAIIISVFYKLSVITVETTHPVKGPAVQAVYATGTVEATVMMPIAARSTARLIELNADEGSSVRKDQVLGQLEDKDIQSALVQLRAQEEFARKEYERNRFLMKNQGIARQVFERSESEWKAAKAATARTEAELGYLKLVAPADGMVIKRDGEIGQLIPANQPVFWLSCCAPLRISSEVDEEDIALVKIGQPVLIRADAFPGDIFHGTVQAITPKGDPIERSYRVRIEFNDDNPLQIGMTAETNIIIQEKQDVLLLPTNAVRGNKIWLVKDGHLTQRDVETGIKGTAQTEILSGVDMNDAAVLNPGEDFREGRKVSAHFIEAPKP